MTSVAHQLFGQTRSAVLGELLLNPETSLHVRELARLTGASAGSLHRELRVLAGLGLLHRQEVGRQVHYRANEASPVYTELAGLLRKTVGLADVLHHALATLGDKVALAFVFGSVAAAAERASSDVDVMVRGRSVATATPGTRTPREGAGRPVRFANKHLEICCSSLPCRPAAPETKSRCYADPWI